MPARGSRCTLLPPRALHPPRHSRPHNHSRNHREEQAIFFCQNKDRWVRPALPERGSGSETAPNLLELALPRETPVKDLRERRLRKTINHAASQRLRQRHNQGNFRSKGLPAFPEPACIALLVQVTSE